MYIKRLPYPVGITAKTSLPSERQFIAFSCSCFRSTRSFASMECFRKVSRINLTLGFSDTMPCLCLIIATGFGHINRAFHFSPIRLLRLRVNVLYLPSMQALIFHARPLTGLLRLLIHLSQLCSSTLLLPQCMRACSHAIWTTMI